MDQSSPNRSPTIAVDLPVAALPTRHMRAPLIVVLGLGFTLIWIALVGVAMMEPIAHWPVIGIWFGK